jgi:hypothetical protein
VRLWQARGRLIVLGAVAIAAGLVAPFLPTTPRTDLLAGVCVVGGLAMLVVALTGNDENPDGK